MDGRSTSGPGPGFQSLALTGLGFEVLAVDTSETLIEELRIRAGKEPVRPVPGDMRDPGAYAGEGPFEVIACMGDTLAHLRSFSEVESLVGEVRTTLEPEGTLVLEFRDYTDELKGADRALPVRLEDDQIMATFLEYEAEHVNVHDIVFVKGESGWQMHKSAYAKLRLRTAEVIETLERNGFRVAQHSENKGFARIVAQA